MSNLTLANVAIDILLFLYVIDCIFMGFVIMMQRSKQEGLGAAFGGGFTESIWGAQTSNVLVKATVWAALLFFILSISLARLYSHRATLMEQGSPVQQLLQKSVAPATPATPTNSAAPSTLPAATPPPPASAAPVPAKASTPSAPVVPAKPAGK